MNFRPSFAFFVHFIGSVALVAGFAGCATGVSGDGPGPLTKVTPSECLAMAERYATHEWRAAPGNVLHGLDPDGQRVDTPDAGFYPVGGVPGYWTPRAVNVGVPYCWGGHDTPESFDRKVRQGKAAGDVYTAAKRAGLEGAVSRHAAGVDCSGFVSRCWGLAWHCSTRTLPLICDELPDYQSLRPGDALSKHNHHVVLFAAFTHPEKTEMLVYETGSPLGWKVAKHTVSVAFLQNQGFRPYRYRGMVAAPAEEGFRG
jgi:hypothetical protein